ncbi:glycine-rich protein 23-like [Schistocerca americana]|uniref:glycine-rich protein 23-like n=1 Tax=Schistocerca americana TaxID=7009 RepID=UPI001F4FB772|nr:glycine-rich protein 23-like [Schistocerca americana]
MARARAAHRRRLYLVGEQRSLLSKHGGGNPRPGGGGGGGGGYGGGAPMLASLVGSTAAPDTSRQRGSTAQPAARLDGGAAGTQHSRGGGVGGGGGGGVGTPLFERSITAAAYRRAQVSKGPRPADSDACRMSSPHNGAAVSAISCLRVRCVRFLPAKVALLS